MTDRRQTTEKLQAIWLKRTHVIALQGFVEDMKPRMEKEYEEYLKPLTDQIQWCLDKGVPQHEGPLYGGTPVAYYAHLEEWEESHGLA